MSINRLNMPYMLYMCMYSVTPKSLHTLVALLLFGIVFNVVLYN